jgi:hypothetical protein
MKQRTKSIETPYLNKVPSTETENSQRFKRVFSEADFNTVFPLRKGIYTYQGLVDAVKAFPAFCGEKGTYAQAATLSLDDVCRKELATLFAHVVIESGVNDDSSSTPRWKQGLYYT